MLLQASLGAVASSSPSLVPLSGVEGGPVSANSSFALYDDVFHSPTKHFSNFVLGCDLRRPAGLQRRFTVAGGACGGVAEREQERVEDVEGENRAREV